MCIVIIFVLWSTCLSSSLVHFKNVSECLTRGRVQTFFSLKRSGWRAWFREVFSVFCDTLFKLFLVWCYYYYYYSLLFEFFTQVLVDGFSDSNSSHVSRTLPVFWPIIIMYSGCSPLILPFPSSPVLLSILWWLFQVHHFQVPVFFFNSLAKISVLILLFAFFQFYSVVSWNSKVHNSASSIFFFFFFDNY